MALSSYWLSHKRKDLAERAIIEKRNKAEIQAKKYAEVDQYHKSMALSVAKYRTLEDPPISYTPRQNEESRITENLKAAAKEHLDERRKKLSLLLSAEDELYKREIAEMEGRRGPWNTCQLKQQLENLQKERLVNQQNAQKRYMYGLYKTTFSPNGVDEKKHTDAVDAWKQRKEESEKLSQMKQMQEKQKIEALEREHSEAEEGMHKMQEDMLKQKENCSLELQRKNKELFNLEKQIIVLAEERDNLTSHLKMLSGLQQERESVWDKQREDWSRLELLRQPKEKLRRMSNSVQQYLESDYKLLSKICQMNNGKVKKTDLSFINLKSAKSLKGEIEKRKVMEKRNELDLQLLYDEEAKNIMVKNVTQWSLESESRDAQIEDMFKNMLKEVNEKLVFIKSEEDSQQNLKENIVKEICDAIKESKQIEKSFDDKIQCHSEKVSSLSQELKSARPSRASSSCSYGRAGF